MGKLRIKTGDIIVGKPLLWNVFDQKGNLLLREGHILETEFQLNALISRGLYYFGQDTAEANVEEIRIERTPFDLIDEVYERLRAIFKKTAAEKDLAAKLLPICRLLQRACNKDQDASIGTILLCKGCCYPVIHSIHTAIVCEAVLKHLGWADEERLSTLAAALTMNIAMIELQEKLHFQKEPLSEAQKREVRTHPERGVEMLRRAGVTDQVWLDIVFQHHELLDGSGYPYGLKDEDITQPARVVALGDIYCAKVSSRAYRSALLPNTVLGDLFLRKEHCVDTNFAKLLVKRLGIYPPGTFVQLGNKEIAIVTHVGANAHCPTLYSIIGVHGRPLPTPVLRDCTRSEFAIKQVISQVDAKIEVNRYQLWGYLQST